jgi:hypothetical protein
LTDDKVCLALNQPSSVFRHSFKLHCICVPLMCQRLFFVSSISFSTSLFAS